MKQLRRLRHAHAVIRALNKEEGTVQQRGPMLLCRLPGWRMLAVTRATAPDWLFDLLEQVQAETSPPDRTAVVVSVVSQGVKLRRFVLLPFETLQLLLTEEVSQR